MTKIILFAILPFLGILFHAQAQLTNQAAITPCLNIALLKESATMGTNLFYSTDKILFMVSSADGKGHVFALLPHEQTFLFDLRDANGVLVKKTTLGIENSQPLDVDKIIREIKSTHQSGLTDQQLMAYLPIQLKIRHNRISPNHSLINNLFVPEDYFFITNKGIYTLDLRVRAWGQITNNQYGVVISQSIRVGIDKH